MIEILFLFLTIQGIFCAPASFVGVYDDVENEAEIVDAAVPLPGTNNLNEKSVPVIRLQIPAGYLSGVQNLSERSQVPRSALPGTNNLAEKALPEVELSRSIYNDDYAFSKHPKSEVETVPV